MAIRPVILNISPDAKKYLMNNLYEGDSETSLRPKDFEFPNLLRTESTSGGVITVSYEVTCTVTYSSSAAPKVSSFFSGLLPGCRSTVGKDAAQLMKRDLRELKLAKGETKIVNRQHWTRIAGKAALIGKGKLELDSKGLKGCTVDQEYWHEVLSPMHVGPEYGARLFKEWDRRSQSPLPFHEWAMAEDNRQPILDSFLGRLDLASNETFVHPQTKRTLRKVDEGKLCVTYLNEDARRGYQATIQEGKLFGADMQPIETAKLPNSVQGSSMLELT